MTMQTLLVANRGEIARRILRTARAMGLRTVAVCSEADLHAPHVREADQAYCLGPAPSRESYLAIERILAAARETGADAIHPGYGFLSENELFARAVEDAGLVFVGPTPAAIGAMGSKIAAKRLMVEHGVPVVPGVSGLDDAGFIAAADAVGYPLLIKASAGGGGKGMRIVRRPEDLPAALEGARREALAAFSDDQLLVERYVLEPRHIEVQILGDGQGRVVHLFERECSIQRRHQKILEEAPSPFCDEALRERLTSAAVKAGLAIGYRSAGTVEFVVDGKSGEIFFLEVNTRLQVEHPVTELVTGLDLVRLQLEIAMGRPLDDALAEVRLGGHAIEARLYAEDPARDFLPETGRLAAFAIPAIEGLRVDSGVEAGDEVSIHYDPMLAKVIAWGPTRDEANRRLLAALRGARVHGVTTNLAFLRAVLAHPAWRRGELSTHFIAEHRSELFPPAPDPTLAVRLATVAHALALDEARAILPDLPLGWRNNRFADPETRWVVGDQTLACSHRALGQARFLTRTGGVEETIEVLHRDPALVVRIGDRIVKAVITQADETRFVHLDGADFRLELAPRFSTGAERAAAGTCQAPMPGKVIAVRVAPGASVSEGEALVVLEAMKMEHTLEAPRAGTVAEVLVQPGDVVAGGQDLIVLA